MLRKQPLHLLYSVLFGISIVIIFLRLLTAINVIFQEPEFGIFGGQFLLAILPGIVAALVHHWNIYRDLGHIGLAEGSLENALPWWVNTGLERGLRISAIAFMLIAFNKGQVFIELWEIAISQLHLANASTRPCSLIGGSCNYRFNIEKQGAEALFLVCGLFLAVAVLSWSCGAYFTSKKHKEQQTTITDKDIRWWIVTDFCGLAFWILCCLLILWGAKNVAILWLLIAVSYALLVGIRFGKQLLRPRALMAWINIQERRGRWLYLVVFLLFVFYAFASTISLGGGGALIPISWLAAMFAGLAFIQIIYPTLLGWLGLQSGLGLYLVWRLLFLICNFGWGKGCMVPGEFFLGVAFLLFPFGVFCGLLYYRPDRKMAASAGE
jgi:hypothetical protein